jgi:hypothetical protein
MLFISDLACDLARYLAVIATISLLVVGEWTIAVTLTMPEPYDCGAILLDR